MSDHIIQLLLQGLKIIDEHKIVWSSMAIRINLKIK